MATSVGENEMDDSADETSGRDKPLFTFSTAEDSDGTTSLTAESLHNNDDATSQKDGSDWIQAILEEYEDDSGDEAESSTIRDG
jgi:hypothetical protein